MKAFFRFIGYTLLFIILLFAGFWLFLNSQAGERWLSKKVTDFASDYLKTTIHADISYDIPDWVVLENFLIEDQSGDTLLAGKKLRVDLDMWALLHSDVKINQIELEKAYANLYQLASNDAFNYEFIVDAFTSPDTTSTDSSGLIINIRNIDIKDLLVDYHHERLKNQARFVLKSLTTGFDRIDPNANAYYLQNIEVDGLDALVNFTTLTDSVASATAKPNVPTDSQLALELKFQAIDLKNARWDIHVTDQHLASVGEVASLKTKVQNVDISKGIVRLSDLELDAPLITYEDLAAPRQKQGVDYGHLALKDLTFAMNNFYGSADSVSTELKAVSFIEKSGLKVNDLRGDVTYTPQLLRVTDFFLQTPYTQLGDEIEVRHPDFTKIGDDPEATQLNVDVRKSYLGMQDVSLLMPDLLQNPYFRQFRRDKIFLSAVVRGSLRNLNIPQLDIRGLGSHLAANGFIQSPLHSERSTVNLTLKDFSTQKATLELFLPDSVKANYGLPERIQLAGTVKGAFNDLTTKLQLASDLGNGQLQGNFKNFMAQKIPPAYNGTLALSDFNLQKLLKNDALRTVSLTADFDGTGIDPATLNATVNGIVQQAYYDGYNYTNINLAGKIADNQATFALNSADPNVALDLKGTANLATEYPTVTATGLINQLDLRALGFTEDTLTIKGNLAIDFNSTNPANPRGIIDITNGFIDQGKGYVSLGEIHTALADDNSGQHLQLTSDFLKLKVDGNFDYTTLANAILTEISTYFKLPMVDYTPTYAPSRFTMKATLVNQPVIQSFVPELTQFKPIQLNVNFDNTVANSLGASLAAPYVVYDSTAVSDANFNLTSDSVAADYGLTVAEILTTSFRLRKGSVDGNLSHDKMHFALTVKDSLNNDIHGLAGDLMAFTDHYQIALDQKGTLIHYEPWQAQGDLQLYKTGIIADAIRFSSKNQLLTANSQEQVPNAPLAVTSQNIDLNALATAFLQDSTLISGFFNADILVKNLDNNPAFTGNFSISDMSVMQIPVGELKANAANKGREAVAVVASLTGEGNDFRVSGDYNLTGSSPLDLTLDIKELGAKTIEAFSLGELENAKGELNGKLKVTGEPSDPIIKGDVFFDAFTFTVKQLGTPFTIDKQQVNFNGQYVQLNNFILTDSLGRNMTVTGRILYPNLPNYSYNFTVNANDFLVADAKRNSNQYFYGNATIDADLSLAGSNSEYNVNGDVKVKSGSNITVYMPEDDIDDSEMESMVTFVDFSNPAPLEETEQQKSNEKQAQTTTGSSEVTLNVNITDGSELNVLIDELTGDNLRVRGNANLRTVINSSNEVFIYGDYVLTEGDYELSISLLKKDFSVRKGSSIRWVGDPMTGIVDITAAYNFNASLDDFIPVESTPILTSDEQDALKRPMPLTLLLLLQNSLDNLQPSFAVAAKEEDLNARGISDMERIRNEGIAVIDADGKVQSPNYNRFVNENYVNQQALWILASGRFSPLQSGTDFSNTFSAEAVGRQTVSKILNDQLEHLTSNLIQGVDVNVGVSSDYASGERSTEINLGVSKAFLDDRLSISVGRNFELEDVDRQSTEILDNVTVSYKLSEDGKYRVKAYRKNQYQDIAGFVIETGVGFLINFDYDKTHLIYKRKEEEEKVEPKKQENEQ